MTARRNRLTVFNYDPRKLAKARGAINRVKAGLGDARFVFIGNSTELGFNSFNGGTGDQKTLSTPGQLAAMLNAEGVNAHANSLVGNGGNRGAGSISAQYDPRLAVGSSWGPGVYSLGGQSFVANTNTNALSFTPTQPVDTFRVYYIQTGGGGTFSADIDGSGAVNQSTNATPGPINSMTVSGTLGLHTCNVKWVSGGNVYIVGFEAYDGARKWASMVNAGWAGSQSNDWASDTAHLYDPAPAMQYFNPDAIFIGDLSINDEDTGQSVAQYVNNVQRIVTAAKATNADVILLTQNPTKPGPGVADVSVQQAYMAALFALAQSNDLPLVDIFGRWGGLWEAGDASGFYGPNHNTIHPGATGYADRATVLFDLLDVRGKKSAPMLDDLRKPMPYLFPVGPFASIPAAASATFYYATDVGPSGTLFISNGSAWKPIGGECILAQSASSANAVTGTTTETTLATVNIPAGLMGLNRSLEVTSLWSYTNSANNKTLRVKLGGTSFTTLTMTTTATERLFTKITNQGAANAQVGFNNANNMGLGNSSGGTATGAVDTSAATTLTITGQLALGTESINLQDLTVKLIVP